MPPLPDFLPHRLLPGGHLQTLAAFLVPQRLPDYAASQHVVTLADGDRIVLHDDCPREWQAGDRTALLIHGLAGCHGSPYLVRLADRLNAVGVRTFRMDLRGCGAGLSLARLPYHSGRSEDAAAALEEIARLCPGSPTALIGFSLGGNITLKLLGEAGSAPPRNLVCGVAVCPPVDLAVCVAALARPLYRWYDRYFARLLLTRLEEKRRAMPEAALVDFVRRPRGIYQFDDAFTAPVCGYGTADNYYRQASSLPLLSHISVPTLILAAEDDPLVLSEPLRKASLSSSTCLHMARCGGHLGFVSRRTADPDRRWMDWRIVDWVRSVV
jgi:predicted alpha/beta-fold hydrolase